MMASACCAALGLLAPQAFAETGSEPGSSFELAFWQAVATSNDPVLYEAYLKQFPSGTFASIAQVKVGSLRKGAASGAAPATTMPLPVPQFGQAGDAGAAALASTPGAASALRDAAAAQRTAEAAQAAAAEATPVPSAPLVTAPIPGEKPVVTALVAPPAPMIPPTFTFGPNANPAASDAALALFASTAAMPVGSAALLASLSDNAVRPASPLPTPVFAEAAPVPVPIPAPAAAVAAPAMLATLGAAPHALPSADALEAAVAGQVTPPRLARLEVPLPAPRAAPQVAPRSVARPTYAAAAYATRPLNRRASMGAGFTRAVISTAAVSVEMPDAARQISPLGIMLGQLVRSQETPGTQYGLQEEVTMPLRPRLMAMPEVALPETFCSAEQRSAFDEGIYRPALAIAEHNAALASAYVRKLRTLYDNYQLSGDSTAQASIAAEAKDFARAANAAGSIHDALVNQFEDIMTTPIRSCGVNQ